MIPVIHVSQIYWKEIDGYRIVFSYVHPFLNCKKHYVKNLNDDSNVIKAEHFAKPIFEELTLDKIIHEIGDGWEDFFEYIHKNNLIDKVMYTDKKHTKNREIFLYSEQPLSMGKMMELTLKINSLYENQELVHKLTNNTLRQRYYK